MAKNLCITYTEVVVVVGGFYIGKCPRIVPFLENNGPRPLAGPRSIIFKEWSDTRTFSYTYRMTTISLLLPFKGKTCYSYYGHYTKKLLSII